MALGCFWKAEHRHQGWFIRGGTSTGSCVAWGQRKHLGSLSTWAGGLVTGGDATQEMCVAMAGCRRRGMQQMCAWQGVEEEMEEMDMCGGKQKEMDAVDIRVMGAEEEMDVVDMCVVGHGRGDGGNGRVW